MSDDLHQAIGEANGKLDTVLTLLRDHIIADERRFAQHDEELKAHAADINKVKGAKGAVIFLATGVSVAVAAVAKLLGH